MQVVIYKAVRGLRTIIILPRRQARLAPVTMLEVPKGDLADEVSVELAEVHYQETARLPAFVRL